MALSLRGLLQVTGTAFDVVTLDADVFEYIEVFYNRKRRHGFLGNISPAEFEHKTTGLYETVH